MDDWKVDSTYTIEAIRPKFSYCTATLDDWKVDSFQSDFLIARNYLE